MQTNSRNLPASQLTIRQFQSDDFPAIRVIYKQGIDTKNATFETEVPDWNNWDNKFLKYPRLVAVADSKVVGWTALSAYSSRSVYSGVCEVSIYIHTNYQGRGLGRCLLKELINVSERNNIWTLQAGIFPGNNASIKIHMDLGFRVVGVRSKIGKLHDDWRDVILLERRSSVAG